MLLTGAPLARSIRTRAPLFVNGRSKQKRVISGRLTMPMTTYSGIGRPTIRHEPSHRFDRHVSIGTAESHEHPYTTNTT